MFGSGLTAAFLGVSPLGSTWPGVSGRLIALHPASPRLTPLVSATAKHFRSSHLAAQIGIRKASIHHHFPTKECLGAELIKDYIHRFTETLGSIEARHPDPLLRLREFSQLFVASAHDGLLPLCGALAAEMAALPISLQELTREFFESQLDWLTATLNDAVQLHHWLLDKPVEEYAFMLLSTLEGSSLIDWALGRSTYPLAGFNHLLETLAIRS